jgi:hypothetical protein
MERRRRKAGRAPAGSRGNAPDLSPLVIQAAQVERRPGVDTGRRSFSLADLGVSVSFRDEGQALADPFRSSNAPDSCRLGVPSTGVVLDDLLLTNGNGRRKVLNDVVIVDPRAGLLNGDDEGAFLAALSGGVKNSRSSCLSTGPSSVQQVLEVP